MNRRIKQVWLLAILSSFLLIGLQTYWLYNSVTYSMGEMGKKKCRKGGTGNSHLSDKYRSGGKRKITYRLCRYGIFFRLQESLYYGLLSAGYGYNHWWSSV